MKLNINVSLWAAIIGLCVHPTFPVTAGTRAGKIVDITAFGAKTGDQSDTTPAVIAALAKCRVTKVAKLVFPPGRYDFWPDRATERYCFISNNDEGLKRIAFPLEGMENLEIDGQGAQFVFHGWITPFVLDHARNITLKNFSIDWGRTFHSEGKVIENHDDGVTLEFSDAFPYEVRNGILVFTDGQKSQEQQNAVKGSELIYPYGNLLEFDSRKRETVYMASDYYVKDGVVAKELGQRQVRIFLPKLTATPGNILVFGATHRDCPAIVVSDSSGVELNGVNIYHCGGMGVIAQRSRDIHLDHVQVTPSPGSGRVVSITADATHFANCSGRLLIENCRFENQMDDASNIHGIYVQVIRQLGPDAIEVKLKHPQQFGFDFIVPGETLEFVDAPSMATYHQAKVKSVERLNKEFTRVLFKSALPKDLKPGDVVASVDSYPEVTVRNCVIGKNRARGLLLGSRGKMVIENNHFHTPGAALLFEGDARFWFEQSGVRDVLIRSNVFDNCNFGLWGNATIAVGAGIEKSRQAESRYNRNIVIEDNLFRTFDTGRIVSAYSVDGLTIRRNLFERTADYPSENQNAKRFDITDSDHVNITE
jgi:hypothetical protein